MNDPNGMFFYRGEYHLFYQYYPDSTVWGPMHWGHAVSKDLTHWQHLPVALYPDSLGYIFSGSAVVDWQNSTGFGQNGQPPIVAIFTYHDMAGEKAGRKDFQSQGIAYSNDQGRTWAKYSGNPVIPNAQNIRDFRDPKVFWHEASKRWVMVFAAYDQVKIWTSTDLKHWEHQSDFGQKQGAHGGVWECPDLFPLKTEGENETKWVLLLSINPGGPNGGSATQYFVGDFDGKTFVLDPAFAPSVRNEQAVWLDHGRDNYAGVTWSDIPASDGRRLFLGWMSNWDYATVVPTEVWRSAMTLPRELILRKTGLGHRVFSQPAHELKKIRTSAQTIDSEDFATNIPVKASPAQLEMILEFELLENTTGQFGIEISNPRGERYRVGYDAAARHFFSDRTKAGPSSFSERFAPKIHTAPRSSTDKIIQMHVFFDAASAEMFADSGETVMTDIFFPSEVFTQVRLFNTVGKVRLLRGKTHVLQSVWRR